MRGAAAGATVAEEALGGVRGRAAADVGRTVRARPEWDAGLRSALGLQDLVLSASVVDPHVAAFAAVELASKRQERGKLRARAQPFEHGLSRDMVEGPYSVDRQDSGAGIAFGGDLEELVKRLGARTGAQAELVGHACRLEGFGEVLCQGPGDEAAKNVPDHQGAHHPGIFGTKRPALHCFAIQRTERAL